MVLNNITIDDLLQLKFVSDPQVSPDGEFVIFCVKKINQEKNCYEIHLYLGDVQNGTVRQVYFRRNQGPPASLVSGWKTDRILTSNGKWGSNLG